MTELVWDTPQDRIFESGLDRGVIYRPDGSAIPWSGLTNVQEKFGQSVEPVYFDGSKMADIVVYGGFSAVVNAITYPDELESFYGSEEIRSGLFLTGQPAKTFGFSYRTRVGSAINGDEAGYKIHVVYNAVATPSDRSYSTVSDSPSVADFEWELTATPENIPNYKPSAHIVIDTTRMAPSLLTYIEDRLYGTGDEDAQLIPIAEMVDLAENWYLIHIVDFGDGTFVIQTDEDDLLVAVDSTTYDLYSANVVYVDEDEYDLSSTENPEEG